MNAESLLSRDEQVLLWLLRVARRADATARVAAASRDLARRIWLRAECEVFELAERTNPEAMLMPAVGDFPPGRRGRGAAHVTGR